MLPDEEERIRGELRLCQAKCGVEKIGLGQLLDVVSIRERPAEAQTTTERMNQGYATRTSQRDPLGFVLSCDIVSTMFTLINRRDIRPPRPGWIDRQGHDVK